MLPLKHQQAAFENIYLKAQEGMKIEVNPTDYYGDHPTLCLS